jgi:hypothetical protein
MKTFKEYWISSTPEEKQRLAKLCGLSNPTMLSNIAHGRAKAGIKTLSNLQRADPRFTLEFMRPDLGDFKKKSGRN